MATNNGFECPHPEIDSCKPCEWQHGYNTQGGGFLCSLKIAHDQMRQCDDCTRADRCTAITNPPENCFAFQSSKEYHECSICHEYSKFQLFFDGQNYCPHCFCEKFPLEATTFSLSLLNYLGIKPAA